MQHRVHGDGDQTGPACIFDDRHCGRVLSRVSLCMYLTLSRVLD